MTLTNEITMNILTDIIEKKIAVSTLIHISDTLRQNPN